MEKEVTEFGLDGWRKSNGNAKAITCDEMVVVVTEWRLAAELGNLVRDMVLGKASADHASCTPQLGVSEIDACLTSYERKSQRLC
jgi:hypothetical protein